MAMSTPGITTEAFASIRPARAEDLPDYAPIPRPAIEHNIVRAVNEIAAANGVSNVVTHLIYSHHHADHVDGSRRDVPGSVLTGDRWRADRAGHSDATRHTKTRSCLDRVAEQRRLTDPGRSVQDDPAAAPAQRGIEQQVQLRALTISTEQLPGRRRQTLPLSLNHQV